jgi:hypothetical protein
MKKQSGVFNARVWLLLATIPLLVLGIDFLIYPQVFERRPLLTTLDASTLLDQRLLQLGTVHSIDLNVAFEDLNDRLSLAYLGRQTPSGLVVSIFVDSSKQRRGAFVGQLARTVQARVQAVSAAAGQRLLELFEQLSERQPGDVVSLDLQLTAAERNSFPVDRLIVVVFEKSGSANSAEVLGPAMARVIADADNAGLAALAVPCIGYQPTDKNSLTFEDIFRALFAAFDGNHRPLRVFVSLYTEWPTFALESAVSAFNESWRTSFGADPGWQLLRIRYRMLLPLITLCLVVCRRRAEHTIKSLLLISVAYIAIVASLTNVVEFFTKDYPERPVSIILFVAAAVLALGFPVFLNWDVRDVFRRKR